jgi:hypothetical protein
LNAHVCEAAPDSAREPMPGFRLAMEILLTASDVADKAVDLARSTAHGGAGL